MTAADVEQLIGLFLGRYCRATSRSYHNDFEAFGRWQKLELGDAFVFLLTVSSNARDEIYESYRESLRGTPLSTIRRRLSIISNFLMYAKGSGFLTGDIWSKTLSRTPAEQPAPPEPGNQVSEIELMRIRSRIVSDASLIGRRDLAIFDLLFLERVSLTELGRLCISDLDLRAGTIMLPATNRSPRRPFNLSDQAAESVSNWIEVHPQRGSDFAFVRLDRAKMDEVSPLSGNAIKLALRRRASNADSAVRLTVRAVTRAGLCKVMNEHAHKGLPISHLFAAARPARPAMGFNWVTFTRR